MAEVEQAGQNPTQERVGAKSSQSDIDEEKLRKVKLEKQRQDQIHAFIIAALLGMSYIFYSDYASFREQAPKLGIEMRPISDFYYICITAAGMHIVRRVGDKFIRPAVEGRFLANHGNLPDRELRLDKLTRQIYDSFFYFSVFCFGYYIAGDIEYLPSCIGGAGTCDSLGMYWPKMKLLPIMRTYIIIQFGHHLHNLVYHTVAMKNVGNYFEMIVHHYAAVISLFYSYFTNWEDYAFIILISHDLSDAILNFGKVVRDLGYGSSVVLSNRLCIAGYNLVWPKIGNNLFLLLRKNTGVLLVEEPVSSLPRTLVECPPRCKLHHIQHLHHLDPELHLVDSNSQDRDEHVRKEEESLGQRV
jgi:TLC domain